MIDICDIGLIGKPHGTGGEVGISVNDPTPFDEDQDYLFLMIDGLPVPFRMEDWRFTSQDRAIVKLEDVDTPEEARRLTGLTAAMELPAVGATGDHSGSPLQGRPSRPLRWPQLRGFCLIDAPTGRELGRIEAVDDGTENVLLELGGGRLVPAAEDLIESIDPQQRVIRMSLPDGLTELWE